MRLFVLGLSLGLAGCAAGHLAEHAVQQAQAHDQHQGEQRRHLGMRLFGIAITNGIQHRSMLQKTIVLQRGTISSAHSEG